MTNIMVVEDEGIVARDICQRLTKMGYDVAAVVDSGEAAIEKASGVNFDLVLMDIVLKGELDGTQAARQLYDHYHVPVVYLTAHADSATLQRAKETQPFGYVLKPFQEEELKTSIEMALAKHQSEESLRQSTVTLQKNNDVLEARVAERTADLQEVIALLQQEVQANKRAQQTIEERDAQLRQAQKLEAVGRLAGGVTHDFNNQLAIMQGYLDMVIEMAGNQPSVGRYLHNIGAAINRASGLTRQLLLFTSHQPVDLKILNLNKQVQDCQEMLRRILREDILLHVDLEEGLWPVQADAVNIDQVITNLVVNARDAMPRGGMLTLQTRNVELAQSELGDHLASEGERFVRLSVQDTGAGMNEDVLSKIFDPFFTTKLPGEGTGLGLSVVYGIVQSHGGWITANSTPGEGSCFQVYLPVCYAREDQDTTPVVSIKREGSGAGERILIVEDDEHLRAMLAIMVEQNGYVVDACGTQKEALQLLKKEDPYHLVLSDVMLPDGRGTEMAVVIQQKYPQVPLVLMTGYPGTHLDLAGIRTSGFQLVQKPIARQDLLNLIYETLKKEV